MSACLHCGSAIGAAHLDWCRENIPVERRIAGWAEALFANGRNPRQVAKFATPEDLAVMKEMA